MAQLVEHILGKDEVIGSIPISSSKIGKLTLADFSFSFDLASNVARERAHHFTLASARA